MVETTFVLVLFSRDAYNVYTNLLGGTSLGMFLTTFVHGLISHALVTW